MLHMNPTDAEAPEQRLPVSGQRRLRSFFLPFFILTTVIWLLWALHSFSPSDPGWSYTGTTGGAVQNGSGALGAWMADLLYWSFGWCAWLLGLSLMAAVLRWYVHGSAALPNRLPLPWQLWGFVLTTLPGCVLLSFYTNPAASDLPNGAGGALGMWAGAACYTALGSTGAPLLAVALLMLGISLLTGLSWTYLVELIGRWVCAALLRARAYLIRRRHLRREHKQQLAGVMQRSQDIADELARREARQPPQIRKPPPPVPSVRVQAELQRQLFVPPEPAPEGELPQLELLDEALPDTRQNLSDEALEKLSRLLEIKLRDFGVEVEVVAVHPGPVITRFEIQPAAGVKVARISGLSKDLARSMAVVSVRVVEVIPGKSTIGLEVPNEHRETVRLREVLSSQVCDEPKSPLLLALGKDISGRPCVADLAKMPHLLVAGTTGSGKSVGVNAMILSLLFRADPSQVRMILIDPKMLELSVYEGIPHLLTPVVTDMKNAARSLNWCVAEMERRYKLMAAMGVRTLASYNNKVEAARQVGEALLDPLYCPPADAPDDGEVHEDHPILQTLPSVVVVIDEFADMIMVVGKKVEESICRLAQKARAAGIHLVLATQRPSVNVITGLIKANIPSRISFQVSSKIDSRTILDQGGAEQLLGHGDMLYLPPGTSDPQRIHGAFVADEEVHRVVADWKQRGAPDYIGEILSAPLDADEGEANAIPGGGSAEQEDDLYDAAVAFVVKSRRASISSVQRTLRIGYNRAARLVEAMEAAGVVSPMDHSGSREVLVPPLAEE